MTDSKEPGFWHTLPGILTAVAGVITAVTGLIVALNQWDTGSALESEVEPAPSAVQAPAGSSSAAESRGPLASPPSAVRPVDAGGSLSVGPPSEVRLKDGSLVFSVLTAKLEPFNAETRVLNIRLRILNNMKGFDRSYYSELRAVADGLPQAPVDPPLEQIEAHSAKDLTYTFRLPTAVRSLTLRIMRDEEVAEIPVHLN